VLFTSSGAVYGRQPPELERVSESYAGAPNALDPRFAYHEAKRLAELLHVAAAQRSGVRPKIARLFAFVGPYLPLNAHFAIGNFIRDALDGGPIVIRGDGTPIRSYLYAADMATWLWRILVHGEAAVAYNVGSEMPISIEATAQAVAACAGLPPQSVEIRGKHAPNALAQRYVPDTGRARAGLGLQTTISIAAAIERTMAFYRASPLTRPITSFSKR
jgi:dTDP-glucose 4,6-dehydratase